MKASELRIGNLVKYMDEYLPVFAIDSEKELKEYDLIGVVTLPTFWNGRRMSCQGRWINQVDPIELTEELLLKFGFEVENSFAYSTGEEVAYNVFSKSFFTYNSIQDNWWLNNWVMKIQPKYVHELQNLYFALTGEELTIKP